MAIVTTNGNYYIWYTSTGATKKVSDINLAYQFPTVADAIIKAKPASAKGTFVKSVYLSTTMGPGIKLDPKVFAAEVKELV